MIEKIRYINHLNESIEIGSNGIFANSNTLRDYAWNYTSINDKISYFKKGIVKKSIPLIIKCDTEEEGLKQMNKLFEVAEKDVLATEYGKIIINGYYLKCFISGSKKKKYLMKKGYLETTLDVVSDMPSWVKEIKTTFGYNEGSEGTDLDYNNDFDMDYTSNMLGKQLNNPGFMPAEFNMVIYGPCENPTVTIAGHVYKVNASVLLNEYLTIDSISKTIILTHTDGTETNCFNLRNKQSYIFEKIPSGMDTVASGAFKFDVTLYEERSEPKWI